LQFICGKILIGHIVSCKDNVIKLARNVQDSLRAVSILPRNLYKSFSLEVVR
jgi:hypothetical protein